MPHRVRDTEQSLRNHELGDIRRLYEWRNAYGQRFITPDPPEENDLCASAIRVWAPIETKGYVIMTHPFPDIPTHPFPDIPTQPKLDAEAAQERRDVLLTRITLVGAGLIVIATWWLGFKLIWWLA